MAGLEARRTGNAHIQRLLSTATGAVMWSHERDLHQLQQRCQEPLCGFSVLYQRLITASSSHKVKLPRWINAALYRAQLRIR